MHKQWIALGCVGLLLNGCGDQHSGHAQAPTDTQVVEQKLTVVPVSTVGHDRFYGVTISSIGDIYAVGNVADSTAATADFETVVMKFDEKGVVDTSFGNNGVARINLVIGTNGELARGIAFQSDGKIVVSATVDHVGAEDARDRDIAVARINSNGTVDETFGSHGVAIFDLSSGILDGSSYRADSNWNIVVDSKDRLILSGSRVRKSAKDTDFVMLRLSKDGDYDKTFADSGIFSLDIGNNNASARQVVLLDDGKILGCGYMTAGPDTPNRPVLYRLLPNGALDTHFGNQGYVADVISAQAEIYVAAEAYAAVLQGDKIITTGYGRKTASDSLDWVSFRFKADGMRDTSYGHDGVAQIDVNHFNDNSRSLLTLPDGRIFLVGGGRMTETNVDGMVALLTKNGVPDTTFSSTGTKLFDLGGANDQLWSVSLSPDHRFIAAVGIKGVTTPVTDPAQNDDSVLLILPTP